MGRMLDITRHQYGFPSHRLDLALCCFGVLVLLEIGNEDVGALTGICNRNRAANATVPAGDNGLLILQTTRALVTLLTMIGYRLHLGRKARHGLLLLREGRPWSVLGRHGALFLCFVLNGT